MCPDHEVLSALLDGELGAGEVGAAREHLLGCASCARVFKELECLRALLRAWEVPAMPQGLRKKLGGLAAGEVAGERQGRFSWGLSLRPAAVGAFSFAAWLLAAGLARREKVDVPIDLLLSAHRRYVETSMLLSPGPASWREEEERGEGDE